MAAIEPPLGDEERVSYLLRPAKKNEQQEKLLASMLARMESFRAAQNDISQSCQQAIEDWNRLTMKLNTLEVRTPQQRTFHVQPTTFDHHRSSSTGCEARARAPVKSARRKTPRKTAVAKALAAEGIRERAGRTLKEIVAIIRPRLGVVNCSDGALAKAVARLLPN